MPTAAHLAARSLRRSSRQALLAAAAVLLAGPALPENLAAASREQPPIVWRGPDGQPLPFARDLEVEAFLRDAEVLSSVPIPEGTTGARKLLLEHDGARAHAVFRSHHDADRGVHLEDGRRLAFFLDSYKSEVAAYRLSRLLGMWNVPPAVVRRVGKRLGSVQLWVEGARTQTTVQEKRIVVPDELLAWRTKQTWEMRIFDNLINNIDRNAGNILWSQAWDLWLIDHTRSFARATELPSADRIHRCSRRLFEALARLDEESLATELENLFGRFEIHALLVRRDRVLEHLRSLIADLGEDAVLFDLEAPATAPELDEPSEKAWRRPARMP